MSPDGIGLVLAGALALALWGFWELSQGTQERRRLITRGHLDGSDWALDTPMARLDRRLKRTTLGRQTGRRIVASGLRIRVSTFLVMVTAACGAAVLLTAQFLAPAFGVIAAVAVAAGFFGYLRRMEDRRREEFIGQLPELARVLSNATSAGLAIRTAVEMAAEELEEPARTELGRTAEALRLGQPFEHALRDLRDRLPSRELAVLVSTLVVSARSGGSVITALRNISTTLEDRKETRREVKTIVGHSVATSWTVAAMGVGMLFMMDAISPGALDRMTKSAVGVGLLAASFALFGAGLLMIRRMTRIDV